MRNHLFMAIALLMPSCMYAQTDTLPAIPMQQMDEVEVLSGYKKYRIDSLRTATIYRKNIQDAQRKFKPKFLKEAIRYGEIGIYVPGGVSELADVLSGQKKKDKRLLAEIETDMEERYTAIRYNESVIQGMTDMSSDSAVLFKKTFPMPVSFARTASPLELKMWIRYNYKQWLNRPKDSVQAAPLPGQ